MKEKRRFLVSFTVIVIAFFVVISCKSELNPEPVYYTVSFYTDGGSYVTSQRVKAGDKAFKPEDPVKTGFVFIGWYTNSNNYTAFDFNNPITEDIELYAKWTKRSLITFVTNGGSPVESQEVTSTDIVYKPSNPTREGYIFTGWYSDINLTIPVSFPLSNIIQNITLYAKWEIIPANSFVITYDTNGGSTIESQVVIQGDAAYQPSDPTKDGYIFAGWYSDINLTVSVSFPLTDITQDITLYAKWELMPAGSFIITYDTNGGSLIESQVVIQGDAAYQPSDPTKDGYIFAGWYSDFNLTVSFSFPWYNVSQNITLYAKWEELNQTDGKMFMGFDNVVSLPSGATVNDIKEQIYELTKDTTIKLTGPINAVKLNEIVSALEINNSIQIALDLSDATDIFEWKNWFAGCNSLYSISLPSSVISIQEEAFINCPNLAAITVPKTIQLLPDNISDKDFNFNFAGDLVDWLNSSIIIPTERSKYLNGTILTEVVIPDSISSIRDYAFKGFPDLEKVTISKNVSLIGHYAFEQCSRLKTVIIEDDSSEISIGEKVFINCPLEYVYMGRNTSTSFLRDNFSPVSVELGDSITNIGSTVFSGCTGLASIIIPDSVTTIEDSAFSGCTGLTNITLSGSVTNIGRSAFEECSSLTNVNYEGTIEQWCRIAFWNLKANPLYYASLYINETKITEVFLSNNVTKIFDHAFAGYQSLTCITIPDSVTSIGISTFEDCSGLTSITIPDSVTSIGGHTFSGCTGLTSITIPDGVTSIGPSAFSGCTGLTSFTIPGSVTTIWGQAFSGCTGLTSITIPEGITSIEWATFSGCSGLTSITIPDSVTSIERQAFSGCSGLTSITIPDGVTSIGSQAFSGCTGLTSITIPDGVTSIESQAFSGCSGLTSITIPDGVTSIGRYAFDDCSGLRTITIPEGVTSLFDAFSGCTGLTSITIPEGVTDIDGAFRYCSGLTTITIPDGVTSIGNFTFFRCSGLTSITIPDSVTSIGDYAFFDCNNLKTVNYYGSKTQWDSISISDGSLGNSALTHAQKVYNYTGN